MEVRNYENMYYFLHAEHRHTLIPVTYSKYLSPECYHGWAKDSAVDSFSFYERI